MIIRDAVEIRLRMLIPYIDQWPQVTDEFKMMMMMMMIIIINATYSLTYNQPLTILF